MTGLEQYASDHPRDFIDAAKQALAALVRDHDELIAERDELRSNSSDFDRILADRIDIRVKQVRLALLTWAVTLEIRGAKVERYSADDLWLGSLRTFVTEDPA